MRGKAMREVILAQMGALRADAGVELIACKDTCVGNYLTGKADALAVFVTPRKWSSYCLITEYFATASPMIWIESQLSELKIIGGYCGFMDTRVQPSGFL